MCKGNLLLKLGLTAMFSCAGGFAQLPGQISVFASSELQPCLAAAVSDVPNLGSGKADCGKLDPFYGVEEGRSVHAVTVEIKADGKCEAELWKNGSIQGGQLVAQKKCGGSGVGGHATLTCFDIKNLILKCSGTDNTKECTARITRIVEDAPAPGVPGK